MDELSDLNEQFERVTLLRQLHSETDAARQKWETAISEMDFSDPAKRPTRTAAT